jgi:hypothetical protein
MEPRNRCQGINSASLYSMAGRYDNPIPTRCLAPIDFLKIPALTTSHMLYLKQYVKVVRNLKSRYGARNRFQKPSLELSSQATLAGGPVRQTYANLVPRPIAGLKLPAL